MLITLLPGYVKMSKVLEKPARKLFLADLCECKEVTEPGFSYVWSTYLSGRMVQFYVVTIQGIVVEVKTFFLIFSLQLLYVVYLRCF